MTINSDPPSQLHASLQDSFIATDELDAMNADELIALFPASESVIRDIVRSITEMEQAS